VNCGFVASHTDTSVVLQRKQWKHGNVFSSLIVRCFAFTLRHFVSRGVLRAVVHTPQRASWTEKKTLSATPVLLFAFGDPVHLAIDTPTGAMDIETVPSTVYILLGHDTHSLAVNSIKGTGIVIAVGMYND
jgi:hypothetical protein